MISASPRSAAPKRAWLLPLALVSLLAACGGGSAESPEFDASGDPASANSQGVDTAMDVRRPSNGAITVAAAPASLDAGQDLAHAQATGTIKVTSAWQLNTIIVNTINAKVSDYSFHKAMIKGLVAGRLTLSAWTKVYGTGTIKNAAGQDVLCDGVCPSGSQFDDWLDYVLDVKTSYYEIVTPNVGKVPAIVSDIQKKYSISLSVMGLYMDAYYPALSPNGPDIRLDWNE